MACNVLLKAIDVSSLISDLRGFIGNERRLVL